MADVTSPFGNGPSDLSSPAPNPPMAPEAPKFSSVSLPGMDVLATQPGPTETAAPTPLAPEPMTAERAPGNTSQLFDQALREAGAPESVLGVNALGKNLPAGQGDFSQSAIVQEANRGTDEDKAKVLLQAYGPGNAYKDGPTGAWKFRKPGQTDFSSVDKGWQDFVADAKSWQGGRAVQDIANIANQYPNLMQTTVSSGTGAQVGAAVAGLTGVVGLPAAAAGILAGGLTAAGYGALREKFFNDVAINKNKPEIADNEVAKDMLMQSLGDGTVRLMHGAVSLGVDKLKEIVGKYSLVGSELDRARLARQYYEEIDKLAKISGSQSAQNSMDYLNMGYAHKLKTMGESLIGKYDKQVIDTAEQNNKFVPADDILQAFRDKMHGFSFTKDGSILEGPPGFKIPFQGSTKVRASTGNPLVDELLANVSDEDIQKINAKLGLNSSVLDIFNGKDYPKTSGKYAFGSETGKAALQTITDDYSKLLSYKNNYGGIPVRVFKEFDSAYGEMGVYKDEVWKNAFLGKGPVGAARQLDHTFGETRKAFWSSMLEGTPNQASFLADHNMYRLQKTAADGLKDILGNENDPLWPTIGKILQTGDTKVLDNIKILLGEDYPAVNGKIKGMFFDKILQDSGSNNPFGYINTNAIAREFGRYDKKVLAKIFQDPKEIPQLVGFMRQVGKVITSDLKPIEEDQMAKDVLETFGSLAMKIARSPVAAAQKIFGAASQREEALNFFKNEALPKMIERANSIGDQESSSYASKTLLALENFSALSDVKMVNGKSVVVPSVMLKNVFKTMAKDAYTIGKVAAAEQTLKTGATMLMNNGTRSPNPKQEAPEMGGGR